MQSNGVPAAELRETYTISAFFDSEERAQRAMMALLNEGIPRSLIDVAVSAAASRRFFPGRARPYRDSTFSFAGRGALIGLLVSAAFTLAITLLPGFPDPGLLAVVQLFGPNVGVVTGGALGALWALLRRTRPSRHYYRALEREALLLLVQLRPKEEVPLLEALLSRLGGRDVLAALDTPEAAGRE